MNPAQRRLLLAAAQAEDAAELGAEIAGEGAGPAGHADHLRRARPPLQVDKKVQSINESRT